LGLAVRQVRQDRPVQAPLSQRLPILADPEVLEAQLPQLSQQRQQE
jgi:hypothetical protein